MADLCPQGTDRIVRTEAIRRQVLEDMTLTPRLGPCKVYLLNVDELNETAQNVLLKSIEEPPSFAYFLLRSSSRELVLPTILSRSTEVYLPRLTDEDLISIWKEEAPVAWEDYGRSHREFLLRYSEGTPGRGLEFLTGADTREFREAIGKAWNLSPQSSPSTWLQAMDVYTKTKDKEKQALFLRLTQYHWYDSASVLSPRQGVAIQNICVETAEALAANVNAELALSRMVLRIREELTRA